MDRAPADRLHRPTPVTKVRHFPDHNFLRSKNFNLFLFRFVSLRLREFSTLWLFRSERSGRFAFFSVFGSVLVGRLLGEDGDLDHSQSAFDGIGQQEAAFGPDLRVLLHHEPGNLLQALFVMGLGAKVDRVGGLEWEN